MKIAILILLIALGAQVYIQKNKVKDKTAENEAAQEMVLALKQTIRDTQAELNREKVEKKTALAKVKEAEAQLASNIAASKIAAENSRKKLTEEQAQLEGKSNPAGIAQADATAQAGTAATEAQAKAAAATAAVPQVQKQTQFTVSEMAFDKPRAVVGRVEAPKDNSGGKKR